jgi:hypothetical protein
VKKVYPYVMALALVSGSTVYGSAQTAYSGRQLYQPVVANAFFDDRDRDWKEGQKRAQEIGYQDGLQDGRGDFDHHRGFRMERNGSYKNANHGYDGRYGDRGRYREAYREAYARGYHEGYYAQQHDQERERQREEHENPR